MVSNEETADKVEEGCGPKMSRLQTKMRAGPSTAKSKDSRFASFETDPRYGLPSKKRSKTIIDKRFSRMLKDDDFTATSTVDKYGRKLKSDAKKKALQRLYVEEDDSDDDDDDDDDYPIRTGLEKANSKYDRARGGGFSASESDSDSEVGSDDDDDDDDDEEDEAHVDNAPDMQKYRIEQADVEVGEVTNRIAIVNLDWDNIKSVDLMALFKSFVPIEGRIERVSIYPSEFGRERMQREEVEGPPREIFKKNKIEGSNKDSDDDGENLADDDDDDAEDSDEEVKKDLIKEGNDEDFNSDALRTYQLEKLRYYYAIVVCSDINTAQKIYEATDGAEYLSSSNFLDLRFVPDDVTFDGEARDESDRVPENYKPVEFVTDALQHSKVKLTWDMNPEENKRKETIKNIFSGSRKDIAENDLRAYLASDSDSDSDAGDGEAAAANPATATQASKKELRRKKLREALGLADKATGKPPGPMGDMEITFKPALAEGADGMKGTENETTAEKYMRKERERKARRKDRRALTEDGKNESNGASARQQDLGFEDPFFTTDEATVASKSQVHKEERRKKRGVRQDEEKQRDMNRAQLELMMTGNHDEEADHLDHFDMNEIVKAEKRKSKMRGKKSMSNAAGLQEQFEMDIEDDRFKAVFNEHEFAIDPSNPKFKGTMGMRKLLQESRKKRKETHSSRDSGRDSGPDRRENRSKKAKEGMYTCSDGKSEVKAIKNKDKAGCR